MRHINQVGLDLIKTFEGFSNTLYYDVVGYPTIGYGHLVLASENMPETITQQFAVALLRQDVERTERAVLMLARVPLSDDQFAALVSLTYNIGSGNFQSSTLRMKLNRFDYDGAMGEFWKWRRAGGRIISGLVRRRAAEERLFLAY